MFDTAAALALDEAQKQQLEALARAGSTPQKMARKCRVILLASQGVSNYSIAQQTELSRPTVLATRAAFSQQGMESIRRTAKRKRSRPKLTPELEQKILYTTLKTRPPTGACVCWPVSWESRVPWCIAYGNSMMCNRTGWRSLSCPTIPTSRRRCATWSDSI